MIGIRKIPTEKPKLNPNKILLDYRKKSNKSKKSWRKGCIFMKNYN